jgi:hypothetical protein
VSEQSQGPFQYKVVYSELVRTELRHSLIPRAKALGLGRQTLLALKELDHILHVYPEHGEPLMRGATEAIQLCVLSFLPLCVTYGLDRDRRLVYISKPLKLIEPRHP